MDGWLIAIIVITSLFICLIVLISILHYRHKQKEHIKRQIRGLANNTLEMTPEEFFAMRKASFGGKGKPSYALTMNFAGVYILFNSTKNMYYVGQGKEVLNRVNSHFTGKGNGDVYADYKYGDKFTIKMIALKWSKFSTLNDLERNTILTYDAFASGYNKTRGNK
ncbi:MAG: GIY-YIG nuclease family protein [Clostridia bacterium]|nr:GIY-YIG nuclease family protein [Clostridia bacterium]